MEKPILDVCCGSKMFWFDKENEDVVFMDNRELEDTLCDGRKFIIKPDVLGDFRDIPYKDNTFKLVVFDPPHLIKAGESSWLAKKYGKLNSSWPTDIKKGFNIISDFIGYSITDWYKSNGAIDGMDYVLKKEDKLRYIELAKELTDKYNLKLYVGDNDCREHSCHKECCGTCMLRNHKTIDSSEEIKKCNINFVRSKKYKGMKIGDVL